MEMKPFKDAMRLAMPQNGLLKNASVAFCFIKCDLLNLQHSGRS